MFENDPEILPGWKLSVDEPENGIYQVTLFHQSGKSTTNTDSDFDQAVRSCQEQAYNIEKEFSNEWGRFLFETCRIKLAGKNVVEEVYHAMHFGSWLIELQHKRLVYDGNEGRLRLQVKSENGWAGSGSVHDIQTLNIYQLETLIHEMKI